MTAGVIPKLLHPGRSYSVHTGIIWGQSFSAPSMTPGSADIQKMEQNRGNQVDKGWSMLALIHKEKTCSSPHLLIEKQTILSLLLFPLLP